MRCAALIAAVSAASLAAPSALACPTVLRDPQRPGESVKAYEARLEKQDRRQAEKWKRGRQTRALREAKLIFIGRDTAWTPPERPLPVPSPVEQKDQTEPSIITITARQMRFEFPSPSYFEPIDWLRGEPSTTLLRVGRSLSDCGSGGIGDTGYSAPGDLYVFFARKGPLSEETLIDAIAFDKIDNPALLAFVAKHRERPPAGRR